MGTSQDRPGNASGPGTDGGAGSGAGGAGSTPGPGRRGAGGAGPGLHGLELAAAYALLFVLGAAQGAIGSFQYGDSPAPLLAIVFDLLILATCAGAGWGMRTYAAGIIPAIGWLVTSFILAMPRSNGSVIVTATPAGEWYLYGGALAAMIGAISSFFVWLRARGR